MTTDRPIHVIHDIATGETIERPFTDEEMEARESSRIQMEQLRLEKEAEESRIADLKTSAKAKLIAGEPLTAEEADVLVL